MSRYVYWNDLDGNHSAEMDDAEVSELFDELDKGYVFSVTFIEDDDGEY